MNTDKLFLRLLAVLQAMFDNLPPVEEISPESHFAEDLNMESLDIIDFIMAVETNLSVKLDMSDAKNTHTIRDLMDAISQVNPELCDEQ